MRFINLIFGFVIMVVLMASVYAVAVEGKAVTNLWFEEASGDIIDHTNNGINFTVLGNPTYHATASPNETLGYCLDLDGSGDYINATNISKINEHSSDLNSEGTLSLMVYQDAKTGTDYLLSMSNSSDALVFYISNPDGGNNIRMGVGPETIEKSDVFGLGIHNITVIWNASGTFLYVDETFQKSSSNIPRFNELTSLSIGQYVGGGGYTFNGKIDEFLLSADQRDVTQYERYPEITISLPDNSTYPVVQTGTTQGFDFLFNNMSVDTSKYSLNGSANVTNDSIGWNGYWNGTLTGLKSGYHNITVFANNTYGDEDFETLYWTRKLYMDGECEETSNMIKFTMRDEETQNEMNGSFKGTFDMYDTDSNYLTSFAYDYENSINHTFCLYPTDDVYIVDMISEYDSTGYGLRNYFLDNATINATNYDINLYLLNNSLGQQTILNVKDSIGTALEGVIIKIQRYYVGENEYKIIAMTKSDYMGVASTFLKPNTVWYKYVLTEGGETLRIIGPSLLTGTEFDLQTTPSETESYIDRTEGISYSCSYQSETKYVVCTVDVSAGLPQQFCLDVDKMGAVTSEEYNETCTTTASGTLMVNVTELSDTNTSVIYRLSVFSTDGTEDILFTDDQIFGATMLYGLTGILITFLVFVTLSGLGTWNPTASIGLGLVSLFASMALGIFTVSIASLMSLVLVGVIIAYKVKS